MKQLRKFRSNYFFSGTVMAVILCTLTWKTADSRVPTPEFRSPLTACTDTIPPAPITDSTRPINATDTTRFPGIDSVTKQKVDTFSLKISKDSLEAPVNYSAEDSAVVLIQEKKIILYGKTKTTYKDMVLEAPKVELDQQTQVVTAYNRRDSTGTVIEMASFRQGDNAFTSDTIRYNFKTQVGLTTRTFTQQGEIQVIAGLAKKVNSNTTYIKDALFTTCNLDEPHFALKANKMKIITQKLAVSGPAHPEFEGVPIPIIIPFGFYPLSQGRHSGLMRPEFVVTPTFGLGLTGLGYYKVLSDYWDTKIYGDIYSYGGWAVNVSPTYRKRYRYSGAFTLTMRMTKENFKGDPDYKKTPGYFISWSHSVDSRARPGTNFSASVNAGSTKFNELTPNDQQFNYQNQLGSSITYSKTWKDKPFNLTLSANHSQNNLSRVINLNLPDVSFTVSTLYPFQKKDFVGQKWYQKLGIGYNGSFSNTISFYDTLSYGRNGVKPLFRYLLDTAQWSARHSIPISMSLPPLFGGALLISPGISYNQDWLQRITDYKWNDALKKVDTITHKGLYIDQRSSFSLSFNTAVFGTLQSRKSRIAALRHVMRPQAGFSYTPDLNRGYIKRVKVDTTGRMVSYNQIGGGIMLYTNSRKSASVSFGIDNTLEMKWRSRKDTGDNAIKKIRLIDGFGFNSYYDFTRDSLNLGVFNIYFRTSLFDKINLNASANLDPYKTNVQGIDINKYAWSDGGIKPGRITNGKISLSSSFRSKAKDPKKEEQQRKLQDQQLGNDPTLIAERQRLLDYMRQNPAEFVDFNIPWQVSISFSLNFNEVLKPDFSGFAKVFSSNADISGSFNLTPKWNLSMSSAYDFKTKQIQRVDLSISRDMHCWQMSINVAPVSRFRYFSFSISPKASILQGLKINRTRYFKN